MARVPHLARQALSVGTPGEKQTPTGVVKNPRTIETDSAPIKLHIPQVSRASSDVSEVGVNDKTRLPQVSGASGDVSGVGVTENMAPMRLESGVTCGRERAVGLGDTDTGDR